MQRGGGHTLGMENVTILVLSAADDDVAEWLVEKKVLLRRRGNRLGCGLGGFGVWRVHGFKIEGFFPLRRGQFCGLQQKKAKNPLVFFMYYFYTPGSHCYGYVSLLLLNCLLCISNSS
ncbi:hypothetical protein CDAR_372871 [Caerostris darwini]|uniref:Uncharacterized protein n=1 Tax=Caerostris darwini TaxID=1538125 RepID=A0AAV4RU19_9ARAC|nr:hypothetical protein CDAR_372761 [Caerostris darwini]GIY24436.1 hypothetical protein CDAR_372871 [Caerostris darwini]